MTQQKNTKTTQYASRHIYRKGFRGIINSDVFAKVYVYVSLTTLMATTVFWSILSASLHRSNADQLVNSYLFERAQTFHGALIPGQHSYLLKWPLFFLIKALGSSPTTLAMFTIGTALVTVSSLVIVLYMIERRPLVFGTLCFALASVLLLIPAQPYAGALLPVNMAMLATRNLEYVWYIVSLTILIKSPRIRSWSFWVAIVAMAILIASDKLFLSLSIGGAFLALLVYSLVRNSRLVNLSVKWLCAGVAATALGLSILWFINAIGSTHIINQSPAGPYGLLRTPRDMLVGIIYAAHGILTNFGANPAYDATIIRNIPHQAYVRLASPLGVAYIINAGILLLGIVFTCRLLVTGVLHRKYARTRIDTPYVLSTTLIWTTFAAVAVFIISNHYYAVDARYLTVSLFAVFISAATFLRHTRWQSEKLVFIGSVIIVGIILGLFSAFRTHKTEASALDEINGRNVLVSQVISQHPVKVLVGDYWRVLPTKLIAGGKLNVLPLSGCTQARNTLNSQAWQPNLQNNSFAYLLTFDKNLTDYPACTLSQVVAVYGRPNASTVIAGSVSQPKELLLFYDHGARKSAPLTASPPQGPSTVVPITTNQLPNSTCVRPTIMNIVAHQDDDLLFMNPDLMQNIKAGYCVRTIYITAGDNGAGKFYWLSREQGSEAAYDRMDGPSRDVWIQRIVKLSDHEFITVANPRGNSQISLIFLHLPDGNLKGEGFSASHFESLARLEAAKVNALHSVDGQSSYTSSELVAALTTLLHAYQPTEIHTQANYIGHQYPDHSDHMAVGRYVKQAYTQYETQQYGGQGVIPIKFYIGYPVHELPANVSGADLVEKETVFLDYAKFDGGVCQSIQLCQHVSTYNAYLARQYQNTN